MPRQATLRFRDAEGQDREVSVTAEAEFTIGRHPACSLTISQPSVSRKHARFLHIDGRFVVEDLNSANGTFVNNQRVTRGKVADGDEVRFGDFRVRFDAVEGGTAEVPESIEPPPLPELPEAAPRVVGSLKPRRRVPTDAPRRSALTAAPGATPATLPPSRARREVVPAGGAPSAAAEAAAELEKVRQEVAHWKAQAEGRALLEGQAVKAQDELAAQLDVVKSASVRSEEELNTARQEAIDLKADIEDRVRRIAELEAANLRAEEQIDTLTDRSLKLKEQVQAQQGQLEEYRREKVELEIELAEEREKAVMLADTTSATAGREAELADLVNDLKREVRQKEKAHKDIERQLDLAEYNLRAAREENENLRLALGEDDSARADLSTTLDHLRQVVAEKEAMIDQLQSEVQRWRLRAEQRDDDAGATFTARIAGLEADLAEARRLAGEAGALAEANRMMQTDLAAMGGEIDALKRQVTEADRRAESSGSSRHLMDQVNELRRANRDLKHELETTQAAPVGGGAPSPEMQAALTTAETGRRDAEAALARAEVEGRRLRAELTAAQANSGGGGAAASAGDGVITQLRADAVRLYESINDLASDLRMNIDLCAGYIGDLRPLLEMLDSLPLTGLESGERSRLRGAIEDADAKVTIESAEEVVSGMQEAANDFKQALRTFRSVLQRHGYGS